MNLQHYNGHESPGDYGGLSGNAPHSVCVNTWSLVVEIVWKGLEGVTCWKK